MVKGKKEKLKLNDKYFLKLLYTILILGIIHYLFFNEETIGHDERYNIYIFWIPLLSGIIISGIYFFKDWQHDHSKRGKTGEKIILTMIYIIISAFTSYSFFGQWAHATWNYLNKKTADSNPPEIIYCDIEKFNLGRHPCINFKYQSRSESIHTDYEDIKMYGEVQPDAYQIAITARKGMWNYYIAERWDVVPKKR